MKEERHRRIEVVQLVEPADGIVRHPRDQVPTRMADIGIDCRGIAKQHSRFPLIGIAADEAIEVLKPHSRGPLIKRSRLA